MPENPPPGFRSITPYLFVRDAAAALKFYAAAFGAKETLRLPMPDGSVGHAEMLVGDSFVMLSEECLDADSASPQTRGGPTGSLLLYVDDVDAAFRQAVAAGAEVFMPVDDMFWGDRMGAVTDPFGHRWTLATHIEDVPEDELQRRMSAFAAGEDSSGDAN
jgi:PhnB protein